MSTHRVGAEGTMRLTIAIALTQVGYFERPVNQQKYSPAMGRPHELWCADGLSWVMAKAKVPSAPNSASSLDLVLQARRDGGHHGPVRGSLVRYEISHVELIVVDDELACGFNTGASSSLTRAAIRSGGAVAVKSIHRTPIDRFGMPAYRKDDGSPLWQVVPYVRRLFVGAHVGVRDGCQVGPDVRAVQHALGFRGDDLDAAYGEHTEGAVKHFQKGHDLEIDGQVGPHTWRALVLAGRD